MRAASLAVYVDAITGTPPNPSGAHRLARAAASRLDEARERIAAVLGATPSAIVITSGGSEADNLALLGSPRPSSVVISAIEHPGVAAAAAQLAAHHDVALVVLGVDHEGRLDVAEAVERIDDGSLVSVMAANGETGVVQPVIELSEALRDRGVSVRFHSDAVAAASTHDLRAVTDAVDLVSIAGQKIGAPIGTGVLVAPPDLALHGILVGGPQQRSRRAGTENIPGALALAVALEEVARELADGSVAKLAARRDLLASAIVQAVPGAAVTGAGADRLAGHLHLTFDGVRSEELLLLLDQAGVCAAAGSACSSGAPTASPTLLAMGIDEKRARGALRLTLATSTTDDEVDAAAQAVIRSVEALRSSG